MRIYVLLLIVFLTTTLAAAQTAKIRVAVLNGDAAESADFARQFAVAILAANPKFELLDQDLTATAARGWAGADQNLFNLSLDAAKNLGAAVDSEYFLVIKHEILRRSSFEKDSYFESGAIVFLVSARTGRLIAWQDRYFEADSGAQAFEKQIADLPVLSERFGQKLIAAAKSEQRERAAGKTNAKLIEDLPAEENENFRVPLPFRRLSPEYTAAAHRLDIVATVDIEAEISERGEVVKTEIVRWAGFDLDESVTATVKKMQFRPALRDGLPVGIKVLLRYNFREVKRSKL